MADEVLLSYPDAVETMEGGDYMAVRYDMLGIEFKEVRHGA